MVSSESSLLARLDKEFSIAFRRAVEETRQRHAGEQFYAFILYTTPLLEYADLSANSEEGLARLGESLDACESLRWSPPDWKYHCEGSRHFEGVYQILSEHVQTYGYELPARQARWNVFVQSLKRLNAEGIFAPIEDRGNVVVNIMWGDQDVVAHVESARILNPLWSYLRFARDQLSTLKAWAKEIAGSRSAHKYEVLARTQQCIRQVEDDLRFGH